MNDMFLCSWRVHNLEHTFFVTRCFDPLEVVHKFKYLFACLILFKLVRMVYLVCIQAFLLQCDSMMC
jgi:hypothetical protein